MNYGSLLFSFEGRINRKPYWLAVLALTVAVLILAFIAGLIDNAIGGKITLMNLDVPTADGTTQSVPFQIGIVTLLLYVVQLWPGLALAVKRCHDRGRSGWFLLLQLIPLVNFWVAIEILFIRGTPGPNRFGPDPLQPNSQAIGQVFT